MSNSHAEAGEIMNLAHRHNQSPMRYQPLRADVYR